MTKTRFTAADVRAMVRDLRSSVLGLRVVNVYDLDSKTYLFKLANPGQEKAVLLLESGVRFHTTRFNHTKSDMPSGFSMKLRKHIRTRRLEDVRQVGMDRVVDFKFGSGEASNHVILELYASGNIVLTDYKYEILDLLRTHTYDGQDGSGGDVRVAVRQVYPMDLATTQEGSSAIGAPAGNVKAEEQEQAEEGAEAGTFSPGLPLETGVRRMSEWLKQTAATTAASAATVVGGPSGGREKKEQNGGDGKTYDKKRKGGGSKKVKKASLKQALMQKGSGVSFYGPSILEHCALEAGLRPNAKLAVDGEGGGLLKDEIRRLVAALDGAEDIVQRLDRPGQKGFIQCKELPAADIERKGERKGDDVEGEDNVVFEEFLPQLLAQHAGAVVREFPSFDQAVDSFFGRIVEQKLKQAAIAAEAAVEKKVEFIRRDQERRVQALEERQERMLRHAQLAEAWADEVEKALMVLRSALANGMDWSDLDDLVKAETANGNPVASLIHELRLDRNQVVLSLPTADGDDQLVEVDMMLSAHANARVMYETKKLARVKELKTLEAAGKVLKIAEQQAQKTLQRQAHKRSLQVARKTYWFEKFNWFITSENYVVLSGRDAQQNELVVKKYLRPGDIYVHADLHGASSCVVRNKDPSGKRPVSPLALEEAGCMTVCRSAAWEAKMVTSAWWVYADQVSKTAPSGEYLVTGSFMVRGRKNFLPPRPLEMGFAMLFKLDDSCLAAHAGERREKTSGEEEEGEKGGVPKQALLSAPAAREGQSGNGDGRVEDEQGRSVRFEKPLGLDDQRRNNGLITTLDGDASGATSAADTVASRRASALAALAGVGASAPPSFSSSPSVDAEALPNQAGMDQGDGMVEERASESTRKRLSAKERKLAKKGGNRGNGNAGDAEGSGGNAGGGGVAAAPVANASVPRGKRGKLKRMKKKYADQDEDDRKLAMEALGLASREDGNGPEATGSGGGGTGGSDRRQRKRHGDGDRKEVAAAEAAAGAAISKSLRKAEAELAAALDALDQAVRDRLEEVVRARELDPFEVRALGKFGVADAMDILARFAEADLHRVRNRSGFLAGIMRKHGSSSTPSLTEVPSGKPLIPKEADERESGMGAVHPRPLDPPIPTDVAAVAVAAAKEVVGKATEGPEAVERSEANRGPKEDGCVDQVNAQELSTSHPAEVEHKQKQLEKQAVSGGNCSGVSGGDGTEGGTGGRERGEEAEDEVPRDETNGDGAGSVPQEERQSRRAQKRQEDEEIRKLLEEEGDGGDDLDGFVGGEGGGATAAAAWGAAAAAAFSELDRLTAKPREEDVLLFAVPVCGPYASLRDYRYKVKLTPGKQKRGKASKQAIEVFSRTKDTPTSHRTLIKGVTDNECVAAMIGDVKVSVAGLAQATQAKKKSNKKQAQKDPKKIVKQQTKAKSKGSKGKR